MVSHADEDSPPHPRQGKRTTTVPVAALTPGESPRLAGQSEEHIARLADIDGPLPPVLVDRQTMRVIDGTHRLMAARLRGSETIEVEFFDGNAADAFLRAVQANVTHGYPLSQTDRRAACRRIITTHPNLSDRAIAQITGLGAKTVATIREGAGERATAEARTGRDGRIRPLDNAAGRLRAAELITQQPDASLREIARTAGISPSTAGDVRKRLNAGLEPLPDKAAKAAQIITSQTAPSARRLLETNSQATILAVSTPMTVNAGAVLLAKLSRDPSLRQNEAGRRLLVMLQSSAAGARSLGELNAVIPPHCTTHVAQLARQVAQMWLDLAHELTRSKAA